jgi:hypothetical protein
LVRVGVAVSQNIPAEGSAFVILISFHSPFRHVHLNIRICSPEQDFHSPFMVDPDFVSGEDRRKTPFREQTGNFK